MKFLAISVCCFLTLVSSTPTAKPSSVDPTFAEVDACLRRAAATLPEGAGTDEGETPLEESVRLAVRKSFADANCPVSSRNENERGDDEDGMSESKLARQSSTAECRPCFVTSVDYFYTRPGQDFFFAAMTSCLRNDSNASSHCCTCLAKIASKLYGTLGTFIESDFGPGIRTSTT